MPWNNPLEHPDSKRRLAYLADQPGYPAPLPFADPNALFDGDRDQPDLQPCLPAESPGARLLHGPFVMNGDLCDVMPGSEAIILVSPQGDKILMQNDGKVTFHVPAGWRLVVGSQPLKGPTNVKHFVRMGDALEEVEETQTVLRADHIPQLYEEANPFGPHKTRV